MAYSSLLQVIFQPDYAVLNTLSEQLPETKKKDFAEAMIRLSELNGHSIGLIRHFVAKEVRAPGVERGTLFRSNSVASKLTTFYFNLHGKQYLREVLSKEIQKVCDSNQDLELDPVKVAPEVVVADRVNVLISIAQGILDVVLSSNDKMPLAFKKVAEIMWNVVEERFPDSTTQAIGGLLFLRFICPAIVTPVIAGLVERTPERARRSLVLVTMVLQCTVNMVFFSKEPYMALFNPFISSNRENIPPFFKQISHPPEGSTPPEIAITQDEQDNAAQTLLSFISSYYDAVSSKLPTEHKDLLNTLQITPSNPLSLSSSPLFVETKLPTLNSNSLRQSSASSYSNQTQNSPTSPVNRMKRTMSSPTQIGRPGSSISDKKREPTEDERKRLYYANRQFAKALDLLDTIPKELAGSGSRSVAPISPSRDKKSPRDTSGNDADRKTLLRRHTYRDSIGIPRDSKHSSDIKDEHNGNTQSRQHPSDPRDKDGHNHTGYNSDTRDKKLTQHSKGQSREGHHRTHSLSSNGSRNESSHRSLQTDKNSSSNPSGEKRYL